MKKEMALKIEADVPEALVRIIETAEFQKAYRLRQLLEHLVDKQLNGEEDDLKGYNIGLDVFQKGSDFNPDSDTIVRVQMVRLRRMLEHYYLTEGKSDPVIIEIPKGRYIPAYRENLTALEDHHPRRVKEAAGVLFRRIKDWVRSEPYKFSAGLGVVVLTTGLVYTFLPTIDKPPTEMVKKGYRLPTGPKIAVFPFNNESGKTQHNGLIRGLPAHIIHALSRYRELFILAPDTTLALRGNELQNLDKARKLKSSYILTGGFSIRGDQMAVSAFLRNTKTGQFVWTKDYEKHLTGGNLHEIQNDIASSVAREVGQSSGVINRLETAGLGLETKKSFTAYECVLRFFEYSQDESAAQHLIVRNCLEDAVAKNPRYAQAWAALSWMYVDEYRHQFNPKTNENVAPLDRAFKAARKAVVLDPRDAFNHRYMAAVLNSRGEPHEARDAIRRAVELNPGDADVLADMGWNLKNTGQWDEAFMYARKAIRLNPVHPPWYLETPILYYYRNQDCKQSFRAAKTFHDLTPRSVLRHVFVVVSGMLCEKPDIAEHVRALNTKYPSFLTQPHQILRDHAIPEEMLSEIIAHLQDAGIAVDG